MALIMAAIAAAVSFASSMLTATTSAPFAPAITTDDRFDDRLRAFAFDAFSSREPVSTPDQVRGRLSLENALIVDPASGTGASSTPVPHPTRPVVPPGGSPFSAELSDRARS